MELASAAAPAFESPRAACLHPAAVPAVGTFTSCLLDGHAGSFLESHEEPGGPQTPYLAEDDLEILPVLLPFPPESRCEPQRLVWFLQGLHTLGKHSTKRTSPDHLLRICMT